MSNQETQALNSAAVALEGTLSSEGLRTQTREKAPQPGDVTYVVVDTKTLVKMTDESFNDRTWKRVVGVGRSLGAFTERGCLLGKNGEDFTTDTVVGTLKTLVGTCATKFKDGEKIGLKVKSVKPVLRGGQLTSQVVYQAV